MTDPAPTKTCVICREDLRGQPRVKDPSGRYFCEPCFERAKEAKRRRRALEGVIAAHVVPLDPRPATPLDGLPAITPVPQPLNAPIQRPAVPVPAPNPSRIPKPRSAEPPSPRRVQTAPRPMPQEFAPIEVAAQPKYDSDDALLAALHERESRWPALPPPFWQSSSRSTPPEADVLAGPAIQSTPNASIEPAPSPEDYELSGTVAQETVAGTDEPVIPRDDGSSTRAAIESGSESFLTIPQAEVRAPTPAWTTSQAPVRDAPLPFEGSIASEPPAADTCEATPIFAPRFGGFSAGVDEHSPRIEQEMLLEDGPPAAAFAGCPHCHRPMPTGAIVCLGCGYNVLTGAVQDEDVHRPIVRHLTSPGGWLGPILLCCLLIAAASAGGRVLHGSEFGFFIFAAMSLMCVPAWFVLTLRNARKVEGAQLRIWIVPLYIFVHVFRDSRSKYLRAMTIGIVALVIASAVLGYDWGRRERERERASHRLAETRAAE